MQQTRSDPLDVAVVGGGISGLTAARVLARQPGLRVRLLEREPACGGVIRTDRVDGFVIDTGPDTLLAHKPAALALVHELGLGDRLVAPLLPRTTYVLRDAALRTLPHTSALGLPTDWRTVAGATAFSWRGKLRMAAEPLIPRGAPDGDESIGAFVRRRFGLEAVTYVAEPVLAGLHRGEVSRLSIRALFPGLADAERRHGSVARAWRRTAAPAGRAGSMSLDGGLSAVPARMTADLSPDVARTGVEVRSLERAGAGWTLGLGDGSQVRAAAVVLATPAYAAAALLQDVDPELASLCGGIEYRASVAVALAYPREGIRNPLRGWGFVVPAGARRHVRSASWVSSKWPGRAPDGQALIRASLQDVDDTIMDQPDGTLIDRAHDDLRTLLGITPAPVLARVYRRARAMPQLEVGHLDRMAAIDRRLASLPGLFISASGFRGVGLPACIDDARVMAQRAEAFAARVS